MPGTELPSIGELPPVGERRNPTIVFEHPGEATIPTSIFVCECARPG
jgi:hypothetical protein